ncbi:unnamed protein product [Medioppia subpectinata]|uniref:Autophagy-related protein 2 n=1 Tax=Medioppia subpectinata TaxID=1979941 RepID=A0A7R9PT69_9ACAR|nr:unnamed protein product [Medioppia subpectinata]CAG2100351.1 unnamed protein product [Medioppia subpectinata]
MDIENDDLYSSSPENAFDDKLMEDAMGDNDPEMVTTSEDSDDEPPKFDKVPNCPKCDSPQMDESGFWVLGEGDFGTGIKMTAEPQIRFLTDEPITVVENHFNLSRQRLIPDINPSTLCRYFLEEMTLILHLYDGRDFDDDTQSDSPVDKRADDTKSYKSHKSNKSYYSSEPRTLFENFDQDFALSWRFVFMVQDFEIIDRVMASKIKKMLYEYYSESMPRRKHVNMISIRATAFKNVDNKEECELKISVKPLRVNIDQDTLLFIANFFTTVIETLSVEETQQALNTMNTMVANNYDETSLPSFSDTASVASDATQRTVTSVSSTTTLKNNDDSNKLYFRSLSFAPDVPISLDYHGKHVDFDRGALQGLFLGLGQLNQSELRLKRLHNKQGLLGFDKVLSYVLNEWTKDIKRNQLPALLGGVGPMHSFIQLFQGMRDLVWMPIDQYRRDKRVIRGLQRGAHSFSASTAMATLDLANRLVSLIQTAAQFAHDVVTPPTPGHRQSTVVALNAQPRDLREGLSVGYAYVKDGIHDVMRDMVNAGYGAEDIPSAVGGVVRNIPSSIVRPIIGVTQGASNVLVGMRNQLTPEARKDDHDKWKNASER